MGVQNFGLTSFFSSYAIWGGGGGGATGALFVLFAQFATKCYTIQTCNSIALIFGTNEERVTVDSRTKFAVNLRNIQRVMSFYSHKKRLNFCHGNKVN